VLQLHRATNQPMLRSLLTLTATRHLQHINVYTYHYYPWTVISYVEVSLGPT